MAQINISRQPDYSDLDLDFKINPITGDINKKKGADAIKRSIRNLIFTNYYERPFKMEIGSGVPITDLHERIKQRDVELGIKQLKLNENEVEIQRLENMVHRAY